MGKVWSRRQKMQPNNHQTTAWIVTFLILYIRFMIVPITVDSIFLQIFIIVLLLVLPSQPAGFVDKFVPGRLVVLLVLAFGSDLGGGSPSEKSVACYREDPTPFK